MKEKIGTRLLAGFMAVCLAGSVSVSSVAFAANDDADQVPSYRGAITSMVTGNFSALCLEYLERGTLYGLGKLATAAGDSDIGKVLSMTKRLLGNPQSTALNQITSMCQEILKELSTLSRQVNDCYNEITELSKKFDQKTYNEYHEKVWKFYNTYLAIYTMYNDLVTALQTYSKNPTDDNLDEVQYQYNKINSMYTDNESQKIADATKMKYNFSEDLDDFLVTISPYSYNQEIPKDGSQPSDNSDGQWGINSGLTTYMDALHTCLTNGYSFEHQIYTGMEYGINEVAGYAAVYLNAYRMYVEFGAQMINADPARSEKQKDSEINDLWKDYNENVYTLMRGLEQMVSLHGNEMSTLMRPYDVDLNMGINYQATQTGKFKHVSPFKTTTKQYSLKSNKTKSVMAFYQVKPYGSKTSYAILKGSASGNATIQMNNLVDVLYDCGLNTHTSISADYINLNSSWSPGNYKMLTDAIQLSGLYNAANYGNYNNLYGFLIGEGLDKAQLPSISTRSFDKDKKASGNLMPLYAELNGTYFYDGAGANSDQHVRCVNVSMPLSADNPRQNEVEIDTEDDVRDDDGNRQQPLIMLESSGPAMALHTKIKGSGTAKVYKVSDNSDCTDATLNGAVPMVAKVKAAEGQSIQSVNLVLTHNGSDHNTITLVGESTLTENEKQDSDKNATYSVEDTLNKVQRDSDGNYLIYFSTPYQDANLEVTFGNQDPNLVTNKIKLEQSEQGEILFESGNGLTEKNSKKGENVDLSVRPYSGYLVDTVTVTAADGSTVKVLDTTDDDLRLTPNSKSYSFTMPGQGVTVSATYKKGYVVTLDQNLTSDPGKLTFGKIKCLNEEWLTYPVTFGEGDTVTIDSAVNAGYYVSNFDLVDEDHNAVNCNMKENRITFKMPAKNVVISAEYTKIKSGEYTAKLKSAGAGDLYFVNASGEKVTSVERYYAEGDTVTFVADSDSDAAPELTVTDSSGVTVAYTRDADHSDHYSFTMGKKNVTVAAKFPATVSVSLKSSSYGVLQFASGTPNVSGKTAAVAEGATVTFEAVSQDDAHVVKSVTAKDSEGTEVKVQKNADGTYSVTADQLDITVTANFVQGYAVHCNLTNSSGYSFYVSGLQNQSDTVGYAPEGEKVYLLIQKNAEESANYTCSYQVQNADGTEIPLMEETNPTIEDSKVPEDISSYYSFTMPKGEVTVTAASSFRISHSTIQHKYKLFLQYLKKLVQSLLPQKS